MAESNVEKRLVQLEGQMNGLAMACACVLEEAGGDNDLNKRVRDRVERLILGVETTLSEGRSGPLEDFDVGTVAFLTRFKKLLK